MIDPASPSGDVATVTTDLGQEPVGIAFDGTKIWTVNQGGSSFQPSVSIVIPGPPWSVQTVTTGFVRPVGIVFDGSNMWIADQNLLLKLDEFGAIVQTVALDGSVGRPTFDGVNVIAPTTSPTLWAVRASTGERVGGVSNGPMDHPVQAVFDGQRILVLNPSGSFSLFRASDYSVITFGPLNAIPFGACSDGVNFWITLTATPGRLARY
jgi:hypothetical protein